MLRFLLFSVVLLLPSIPASRAASITLDPVTVCLWIPRPGNIDDRAAHCPNLDTRDAGSRAAVLFDLSGIQPSEIASITLELTHIPGFTGDFGRFPSVVEAVAGLELGSPLDPFIYTESAVAPFTPERGVCNPVSISCPTITTAWNIDERGDHPVLLGGFTPPYGFPRWAGALSVADVALVLEESPFLQLTLIRGGAQYGFNGFDDGRAYPPTLTVVLVPEPSTASLVALGLLVLVASQRRVSEPASAAR